MSHAAVTLCQIRVICCQECTRILCKLLMLFSGLFFIGLPQVYIGVTLILGPGGVHAVQLIHLLASTCVQFLYLIMVTARPFWTSIREQ